MKQRAYIIQNLDGVNRCLAAASNLKEAAEKMGCSVYYMRQMGWRYGDDADLVRTRTMQDRAYYQPIDNRDGHPWTLERWHRNYSKGESKHRHIKQHGASCA